MTDEIPRVDHLLFDLAEGEGIQVKESSIPSGGRDGALRGLWRRQVSPYLRLKYDDVNPPPEAFTYAHLESTNATVLRKLPDGSTTGRTFSHAIVGTVRALDDLALPLTRWPDWSSKSDSGIASANHTYDELRIAVVPFVAELRMDATKLPTLPVLLGRVLAAPTALFTVVGMDPADAPAAVMAVRDILTAFDRDYRTWTFSTFETELDVRLDFVFTPNAPGPGARQVIDLATDKVPASHESITTKLLDSYRLSWRHDNESPLTEREMQWIATARAIREDSGAGPTIEDRIRTFAKVRHVPIDLSLVTEQETTEQETTEPSAKHRKDEESTETTETTEATEPGTTESGTTESGTTESETDETTTMASAESTETPADTEDSTSTAETPAPQEKTETTAPPPDTGTTPQSDGKDPIRFSDLMNAFHTARDVDQAIGALIPISNLLVALDVRLKIWRSISLRPDFQALPPELRPQAFDIVVTILFAPPMTGQPLPDGVPIAAWFAKNWGQGYDKRVLELAGVRPDGNSKVLLFVTINIVVSVLVLLFVLIHLVG
ncbi:hypothetical protein [Actinokineospora sp. HUAS TT18]|uniref:hypothetical protein n=1 Tax=Actinokineospora sp. HUAS TT18 TaxID=3447451 RepID=UPI003F52141A